MEPKPRLGRRTACQGVRNWPLEWSYRRGPERRVTQGTRGEDARTILRPSTVQSIRRRIQNNTRGGKQGERSGDPKPSCEVLRADRSRKAPYTRGGDRSRQEGKGGRRDGTFQAHREEPEACHPGRKEVPRDGPALWGPHPRGQYRSHASGGQVRSGEGLSLLHLRSVADQTGGAEGGGRQGPDHKGARAYGREDKEDGSDLQ